MSLRLLSIFREWRPMTKQAFGIVCLLMAFHATSYAGNFTFAPPVSVQWDEYDGGYAQAVAVADFNGDGRDDLAAIVDGHLRVALQDGSGVLATQLQFEIFPESFLSIEEADLGADSSIEILVGHTGGLAVYKWNGVGGFALTNHPAQSPCAFMATADLNFDGATDIFCLGGGGDATLYYSAAGNVLQSPVYMLTAVGSMASSMAQAQLKDVTGDDKPDLLLADSRTNSFFVYPHDGSRGFLPAVAYPYPEEDDLWPGTIEVADLDGDGSNEVIVAKPCNQPCSSILIYSRGSNGYLYVSKRLPTYDNPFAVLVTDIDQDGQKDLLVGHHGWHAVGRYMGSAQGLFMTELLSSVETQGGSNRYATGDLNHDGYTDLVVVGFSVQVLYGGRQAVNDFNGDLVSDVLWRHSTGKNAVWLSADIATAQTIQTVDPAWSIQAVGDFDGNGIDDAFWRNRTTGANQLWESGFIPEPITGVTDQGWQVVGAGDFNGDGQSDLLWRNMRTGANTIWKSGNSATLQLTTAVTDLLWKVVGVGDFNGDGRSDVLWRHAASGKNAIWRSGQSAIQQTMTGVTNLAWKVVGVGDFNGDGKDDVTWRNTSTGADAIWLSANASTTQTVTGVTNLAWNIAAVGDYNGDGKSDLFWRNVRTGANVIWRSADARQAQNVRAVTDTRWEPVH